MPLRQCYILTCDRSSNRTQFSKNILEKIGFKVNLFDALPNIDKVLSNKYSMMKIYEIISNGSDEYVYVFEDDINILEDITLDEIIEYESISPMFFYLGLCDYGYKKIKKNKTKINDKSVIIVNGSIRGLHAIGLSKKGATDLLNFAKNFSGRYMDMCLESFSMIHPANVLRYDLQSYINGHRGLFFQDRDNFPSTI
jgi:GR25 family glycosyltransferase involved in LPS biosynthesis